MCLAASKERKTTKAPAELPILRQMKQLLPPAKSKTVTVKPKVGQLKKGIKTKIFSKPQGAKTKPKIPLRTNCHAFVDRLYHDSFTSFPSSGKLVLVPRLNKKGISKLPAVSVSKQEEAFEFVTLPPSYIDLPLSPGPTHDLQPSRNPPPIPCSDLFMEQEVAFPENIWLPTL